VSAARPRDCTEPPLPLRRRSLSASAAPLYSPRALLRRSLFAVLAGLGAAAPLHAADPLSVAAPGFPTAFVLDQFNAKAAFIAGKAIGEGSLPATKHVRELQLMIANARAELRGDADDPWDKLSASKQSILRALDRQLLAAPDPAADRGKLENPVVLDVAPQLAKLPFDKATPVVRRVDGATQLWRADGSYRVLIGTNLPAAGATTYALNVAGQPAPPGWLQVQPPDKLLLTIPAAALAPTLAERTLNHVPLEVTALMPKGTWKFWTSPTEPLRFPIALEVFPRKPFAYALKEAAEGFVVDEKKTLIAKGKTLAVPGCGAPGCERDHMLCNDAPAGSKPVEPAFFTDSAAADPSGGWTGAVNPTPTGFCAIYKQRSPTVDRTIGFDVRYHPGLGERKTTERKLKHVRSEPGKDPAEADALAFDTDYQGEVAAAAGSWELVLTAFNKQVWRASSTQAPNTPMLKLAPVERAGDTLKLRLSLQAPAW
jgi:hypothetical protein